MLYENKIMSLKEVVAPLLSSQFEINLVENYEKEKNFVEIGKLIMQNLDESDKRSKRLSKLLIERSKNEDRTRSSET